MMDHLRHAVLIFMLTIVSKASSSVNIDVCTEQTVKVDDGYHGYLRYNRSKINSDSLRGVCQCVITKNSHFKPDVDIWIQDSRICGTKCCKEQLYIRASDEKTYDSCTDPELGLDCLLPRTRSLLNVGSIYGDHPVEIKFYFSGDVNQTTDSFTLDIEVIYVWWKWEKIQIECMQPTFDDSPPSTCSTTYKSTAATALSETRGESTDRPTTDIPSQTASPHSGTPNVGLITGVSISCLCAIAGIVVAAVFITHRNKIASEKKTSMKGTLPKIHKEYDQFSTELVDNTMYSSTNTPDMPSSDMYVMDNPQYSCKQSSDNQLSADMYVMDNPQYSSMPTHPGPELIEDTIYMEADMENFDTTYMESDMDCIDHHSSQQQDNAAYSEVDYVNYGGSMGSNKRNTRDSVYAGGTQLFENAIYDNQSFDTGMSDVLYSGGTELVDNAVYG